MSNEWLKVNPNGSATVDLTPATDEQVREWLYNGITLREIKLALRIIVLKNENTRVWAECNRLVKLTGVDGMQLNIGSTK